MKQKQSPSKAPDIKFLFLSHFLIISLGLAAYANSLNGKFVYDDPLFIEQNIYLKNPSEIIGCFKRNLFAGVGWVTPAYRPLQMASYVINYDVGKMDVWGYHLVNMLLHVMAAICVFWSIELFFSNRVLSLLTAVFFVVHPIQTEAVSYISGRCDPMALFFMLLCAIIYTKRLAQNRFGLWGYLLMLICYVGALASKENSAVLPVLLLFYHYISGKKIKAVEFFSLVGLAAIYIVLRLTLLKAFLPVHDTGSVFERIPGFFVAVLNYIRLLINPFPLHMEYGQRLFSWADPRAITGMALTAGLLAWGHFHKSKVVRFGIGWFFIALLPVSNIFKINFYMAEHFLYVPSLGFFLVVSYFLERLYNTGKYKMAAVAVVVGVVGIFLVMTIRQNHYWKDPLTFYQTTLKYVPDSANIYNNLGGIYKKQGNWSEALADFNEAIALKPNDAEAYNNRGTVYNKMRDYDKAIGDFTKAIEFGPVYINYYNRGCSYFFKGDYYHALLDFKKSLELNPQSMDDYFYLGQIYSRQGDISQAISNFDKALELDGRDADGYLNRGAIYVTEGNWTRAVSDFNKAIEINPQLAAAYNDRGYAYNAAGDYPQAMSDFNKAIELNPHNADAYNNQGLLYKHNGNPEQAIMDFNKVIELDPAKANAYLNRADVYISKSDFEKALLDYNKAIELNPHIADAYNNRGYIYNVTGHGEEAMEDFNKAIEINPNLVDAYNNRGIVYENKGQLAAALQDFNKALELNPAFGQAYVSRAIVYYAQKEFSAGWDDVQKAQQLGVKIDPRIIAAYKNALGMDR